MNTIYLAGLAVAFLAAVLFVHGLFELFVSGPSAEQRRLNKRLAQLRNTARSADGFSLARNKKRRHQNAIEKMIAQMPRYGSFAEYLSQGGYVVGPATFVINSVLVGLLIGFVAIIVGANVVLAAICALGVMLMPLAQLAYKRGKRLGAIEAQLPDTVDLISRSLRAGHAFSPSLQTVADEMPDPIASEFRQIAEEISFGIPVDKALLSLARRVPLDDLRFFVIAVLLQRETGGNLAEILDNIGRLIRERFQLFGQIRVLTAEGRMSGWVLALLPFVTAAMMFAVNPEFISTLWQDEAGMMAVKAAGVMMVAGLIWMWRIVQIRV